MMPKLDPELREQSQRLRQLFLQLGLSKQAAEVGLVLQQAEEDSVKERRMGRKAMEGAFDAIDHVTMAFRDLPEDATNSDLSSAVERVQSDFEVVLQLKADAPSFLKRLADKMETDVWQLAVESASGERRSAVSEKARRIIAGMSGGDQK